MHTALVCFDHLPACCLGCYGAFHASTPQIDALAAEGLTFDACYVSVPGDSESLRRRVAAAFGSSMLVSDRSGTGVDSGLFQQTVHAPDLLIASATELGALIDRSPVDVVLVEVAHDHATPLMLQESAARWKHEIPERLTDQPRLNRREMQGLLHRSGVPEAVMSRIIRGAITSTQDQFLGRCREAVPAQIWGLTSHCGDDRWRVPGQPDWLASIGEAVCHVPLILRGAALPAGRRSWELGSGATIVDVISQARRGETPQLRAERIQYESPMASATRTSNWLFIQRTDTGLADSSEDETVQLFRQPEDRWQSLDVAAQYPEVVDQFTGSQQSENQAP